MTDRGCPIESIAKDHYINQVCNQYLDAMQFDFMEGMGEYRNNKFKEYNLESDLLLTLQPVWLSYKAKIMKDRSNGNY